jgi:hypothetical protein
MSAKIDRDRVPRSLPLDGKALPWLRKVEGRPACVLSPSEGVIVKMARKVRGAGFPSISQGTYVSLEGKNIGSSGLRVGKGVPYNSITGYSHC